MAGKTDQKIKKDHMKPVKKIFCLAILCVFLLFTVVARAAALPTDTVRFTLSMEKPHTHYFHVEMEYSGESESDFRFKMPVWTPGYYWRLDFAKNVTNFSAMDESGKVLRWRKTDLNTWQVDGIANGRVTIEYDVFAYQRSVAEPFLDDGRAFVSPTGVFMFPEGKLHAPVLVEIEPFRGWSTINTGLDKHPNRPNTFVAPGFDVLYDCPVLAGNMEILEFESDGIPYTIAMENPAEFDRETYVADFKKIVESSTALIGDIPYDHYTFLIMDKGMGGLEHTNSMAVFSNSNYDITNSRGYKGWLAFIAHEFFHLYNVKTIRPVELGPFDYCDVNLTPSLWVAEGLTVYYEYIVLNRAGLMGRQEVLDAYSRTIAAFENAEGRKHITARQASFDTWLNFFSRNNHTRNTTISYYDIGCALGLLLDLKIRHESGNTRSLDDVMRTLYFDFHKKQNRGYTEEEFRQVCESVAGCSLEEIFTYAETTKPMDYQKYLSYAGISINPEPKKTNSFGLEVRQTGDDLVISNIDRNSPAWEVGLSIDDQILEVNGMAVNEKNIKSLTQPEKEGEITLKIKRRTGEKEFTIKTFEKEWCDYKMTVERELAKAQKELLDAWLQQ